MPLLRAMSAECNPVAAAPANLCVSLAHPASPAGRCRNRKHAHFLGHHSAGGRIKTAAAFVDRFASGYEGGCGDRVVDSYSSSHRRFFVGHARLIRRAVAISFLRNPLAEPTIVGVGEGAVLGGVIAFVTGWSATSVLSLPLMAMLVALIALFIVYAMSTRGGVTPVATLRLAGVAASSLMSAVASLLLSVNIVNWQIAQEIVFWMMGGLDARTWTHVWLCAPFVLLNCCFLA